MAPPLFFAQILSCLSFKGATKHYHKSFFEVPHGNADAKKTTPARIERATLSLEGWCSIQLSYGARNLNFFIRLTGPKYSFRRNGYEAKSDQFEAKTLKSRTFISNFSRSVKQTFDLQNHLKHNYPHTKTLRFTRAARRTYCAAIHGHRWWACYGHYA